MPYWLFKSDPEDFGIEDLVAAPNQTTCWDGVRNYQARNYLKDCRVGDKVLFYQSNDTPQAVHGVCKVVKTAYPDPTAFDESHKHFDPKSRVEEPTWFMVDIQLVTRFDPPVSRDALKAEPKLADLETLKRGTRLSVHPVTKEQFETIVRLAKKS
jgi:predicted RNA-binding protein with PUA-like domain